MTTSPLAFNPELPAATLAALDRVEWDPPIILADPHDPYACQTCDNRRAEFTVTFPDGEAFEVCGECRVLADALVTVGPLFGAEMVRA